MNETERHGCQIECYDLMVRSWTLIDRRAYEPLARMFGDGGAWVRGGKTYRGFSEIMSSLQARPETFVIRHVISNVVITPVDADRADGLAYYVAFRADGDGGAPELPAPVALPEIVGEVHDSYVRGPDGWRIAKRETTRIFIAPH